MHTTDEQTWDRDDLWEEVAREIDAAYLQGRPCGIVKVSVRDFDLPARVSNGKLYVQVPLGFILEEIEANIPESLRHLEARISVTRSAPLSLTRLRRAFHRQRMAVSRLVSGRGKWR